MLVESEMAGRGCAHGFPGKIPVKAAFAGHYQTGHRQNIPPGPLSGKDQRNRSRQHCDARYLAKVAKSQIGA